MARPGEIFGEFTFIDVRRRSASARALRDSRVSIFSREVFQEFSRRKPQSALIVLYNITKVITDRARDTTMMWRSSQ